MLESIKIITVSNTQTAARSTQDCCLIPLTAARHDVEEEKEKEEDEEVTLNRK